MASIAVYRERDRSAGPAFGRTRTAGSNASLRRGSWDHGAGCGSCCSLELSSRDRHCHGAIPHSCTLGELGRLCPGNCESAGKRLSGKTRKGSPWLGRMACQCAWAAARTKNTDLSAQFRRLAAKRGRKRAIIAVAHSILTIAHYLQKKRCDYRDLGSDYFDRLNADGLKRYLVSSG